MQIKIKNDPFYQPQKREKKKNQRNIKIPRTFLLIILNQQNG